LPDGTLQVATVGTVNTLAAVGEELALRVRSLGESELSAEFNLSLDASGKNVLCRTHASDFHEVSVILPLFDTLTVATSCPCVIDAATLSPWCVDSNLSVALLAYEQMGKLEQLLCRPTLDQVTKIKEVLQLAVNLVGERSMVQLVLGSFERSSTLVANPVLAEMASAVRAKMERRHQYLLGGERTRQLLRRACRGRGSKEVWVLLVPVTFRFSDDPDMRDRALAWALVGSWAPAALDEPHLARMPEWVFRHVKQHLPAAVRSSAYQRMTPEVRETSMTLWVDSCQDGHGDFDESVRTATLLSRS
jgi:hypothetical protein